MSRQLHSYIDVVGKLSKRFKAVPLPMQSFIDKKIKEVTQNNWPDDFAHPKVWTHCRLALKCLKVIGL
jgi:hypothetical protein